MSINKQIDVHPCPGSGTCVIVSVSGLVQLLLYLHELRRIHDIWFTTGPLTLFSFFRVPFSVLILSNSVCMLLRQRRTLISAHFLEMRSQQKWKQNQPNLEQFYAMRIFVDVTYVWLAANDKAKITQTASLFLKYDTMP